MRINSLMILVSQLVLVIALAARLFLLGGEIDIPDWRQADTGYMALRMMEECPPDVLRPKAPYRGTNNVKAAEFPIYPALVGLAYRAVGAESFPIARIVTLLFFIGSLAFLSLVAARLYGPTIGWLSAAVYAVLPIGIPYSRMIHPDFCVMFFANGFFYYAVAWLQRGRTVHALAASLLCAGLFLTKAPYGVYYVFTLAVLAWTPRVPETARRLAGLAIIGAAPFALGIWFNDHRIELERPFVESVIYPMKWTRESLNARFFGVWSQRFDGEAWAWMLKRALILVATPAGALLTLVGMLRAGGGWRDRHRLTLWALAIGLLAYVLLVFPIVTSDHEYYSIPFMPLIALSSAWGIRSIARRWNPIFCAVTALSLIAVGSVYGLQRGPFLYSAPYFHHDWQRIDAGAAIQAHSAPRDLVISVTDGRSTGWSDPRILWRANRLGWAIEAVRLTPEILAQYRQAGANVAAILVTADRDADALMPLFGDATEVFDVALPKRPGVPSAIVRFIRWPSGAP